MALTSRVRVTVPAPELPAAVDLLRRGDRVVAVAPWAPRRVGTGGSVPADIRDLHEELRDRSAVTDRSFVLGDGSLLVLRADASATGHRRWLTEVLIPLVTGALGRADAPGVVSRPVGRSGRASALQCWFDCHGRFV